MNKRNFALGGAATLFLALIWGVNDYRAWVALGEGGLPHNLVGWSKMTAVRFVLSEDPFDLSKLEAEIGQPWDIKAIASLEKRSGERPEIAVHPVPHRQMTQRGNDSTVKKLNQFLIALAERDEARLAYKLSHTELHNKALWTTDESSANPYARNEGEVAHVHKAEGSVHLILSPSDAKTVIEAGWGELHGMSGVEPFMPCPTYIMLYAPRTPSEFKVVEQIIEASVQYSLKQV